MGRVSSDARDRGSQLSDRPDSSRPRCRSWRLTRQCASAWTRRRLHQHIRRQSRRDRHLLEGSPVQLLVNASSPWAQGTDFRPTGRNSVPRRSWGKSESSCADSSGGRRLGSLREAIKASFAPVIARWLRVGRRGPPQPPRCELCAESSASHPTRHWPQRSVRGIRVAARADEPQHLWQRQRGLRTQ